MLPLSSHNHQIVQHFSSISSCLNAKWCSAVQCYLCLYKLAVHLQTHSHGCILGPSCCCVTSCLHPGTEATFDLLAEKPKRHSQKHNIKKPLCDRRDKVASSNEQVSEDDNIVGKKGENKKLPDFDRFMRQMWFY